MSEFKRENRYLVIKWKDAVAALGTRDLDRLQGIADAVAEHRGTKGKAPLSCVVVEADWPIYERVWDEIHRLEEGELAIAWADENNQRIDARLAKFEDYSELTKQRDEMLAALAEIDSCFEAALIEGWNDAMEEEDISRIKDIYCRRIDSARSIAVAALSGGAA